MDAHKNFAISTVATAPSPATSGTSLVVTAGQGARFPAVPFNATVWPANSQPDPTNCEIVRVTNIATDTFTITRAQETGAGGPSARSIIVGDQIAATITAKTLTDVETAIPAFATPAVVLGSAAAAGAASTVIRSDGTIAAFDATSPSTQAFGDSAVVGTAAFAARRDHKHAMPADPFTGAAAGGDLNGTYPNPLVDAGLFGGVAWTTIIKSGDESVASSTSLQPDDELLFAATSGGLYEFEALIIYVSTAGAGTPDLKANFSEVSGTAVGAWQGIGISSTDAVSVQSALTSSAGAGLAWGTAATNRALRVFGSHIGQGGSLTLFWAQNTSGLNATTVKAGSLLRYRRIL